MKTKWWQNCLYYLITTRLGLRLRLWLLQNTYRITWCLSLLWGNQICMWMLIISRHVVCSVDPWSLMCTTLPNGTTCSSHSSHAWLHFSYTGWWGDGKGILSMYPKSLKINTIKVQFCCVPQPKIQWNQTSIVLKKYKKKIQTYRPRVGHIRKGKMEKGRKIIRVGCKRKGEEKGWADREWENSEEKGRETVGGQFHLFTNILKKNDNANNYCDNRNSSSLILESKITKFYSWTWKWVKNKIMYINILYYQFVVYVYLWEFHSWEDVVKKWRNFTLYCGI